MPQETARFLADPASSPSEETIARLVHGFYARVRRDAELGPIFERAIGESWNVHLAKMCDFWSSVMRTSGRYHGNPMLAHMKQKAIVPHHFERWLDLFRESAHELCLPHEAEQFIMRAENIARSLSMGMFYRPAAHPAGTPVASSHQKGEH